ncbi:DUF4349 domain-containing protein [Nocardia lijiangensis]|uniref:DUF4349 domain-containing protein n=1 Tax=Nocardia lijiangensis TaxID=299618 RepID=UPI0008322F55|nr:DUF4349 domain-containing protein [Nocardia lijiangensis]
MRKLAVLCAGLLGLALIVGCGADERADSGGSTAVTAAPAPVSPPGFREKSPGEGRGQDTDTVDRKEVVTGSIEITSGDPIVAAAKVGDRVREAGGRVDSRTEQPGTDDTEPSALLTVRVPADKTDAFVNGLGAIGTLTRVSTNRDDVTMQWEDLDARIKALQASVDRLRALIAGAANTADLIAAEEALAGRQGELDSLTAQKRRLDDQVALSTLTIEITTTGKESDEGPSNFWDGIVAGWNSLVDWLKDAVVFTGRAIPWLGFLAIVGGLVFALVRVVRRKRRPAETPSTTAVPAATRTGAPDAADGGQGDHQTEQP